MFACMQSIRALGIRVAAACAAAAFGAGVQAADFGELTRAAPPAVTAKVNGIAGPSSTTPASSPARAVKVSSSAEGGQDQSGPNRNGTGGPAKVKPGIGPGQGSGVESRGPAPR